MPMQATIVALVLATLSASDETRQNALMDQIERTVTLPAGAAPLDRYTRFYTYERNGSVLGQYIATRMLKDGPNGRRWIANMQTISDGGCNVVNVRFDPNTATSKTWCNGGN
jgi:hypothetical protein